MTAEGFGTDNFPASCCFKPLGSPTFGFHFRHIVTLLVAYHELDLKMVLFVYSTNQIYGMAIGIGYRL